MINILSIISIAMLAVSATAYSMDFDGDGVSDATEVITSQDGITFKIKPSSQPQTMKSYEIPQVDICTKPNIYAGTTPGTLIVDNSCTGREAQIATDIYEWKKDKSNWIKIKTATGVKSSPIDGSYVPELYVERIKCCTLLGSIDQGEPLPDDEAKAEIKNEISNLLNTFDMPTSTKSSLDRISIYEAAEYAKILNKDTLTDLNNLAYYLQNQNKNIESIIILEPIVTRYPSRIVARLNLADSYWAVDNKNKAKALYSSYISGMKNRKMQKKIPSRAYLRAK